MRPRATRIAEGDDELKENGGRTGLGRGIDQPHHLPGQPVIGALGKHRDLGAGLRGKRMKRMIFHEPVPFTRRRKRKKRRKGQ